jgi:hypothetical protein
MDLLCSWCLKEKGIAPTQGDSHGICRKHELEVMIGEHLATPSEVAEYAEIINGDQT